MKKMECTLLTDNLNNFLIATVNSKSFITSATLKEVFKLDFILDYLFIVSRRQDVGDEYIFFYCQVQDDVQANE